MRAVLLPPARAGTPIPVVPGTPTAISVEVTNTLDVIDGVSLSVLASGRTAGRHPERGSLQPEPGLTTGVAPGLLPLFPGGAGILTVTLTADRHYPAGPHHLRLQLVSSVDPAERTTVEVALDVQPVPAMTVAITPTLRRARRRTRYQVTVANDGNTHLDVDLAAADPERSLTAVVADPRLLLPPGQQRRTTLAVRARRQILGNELRRPVSVVAKAGELERDTTASFRHAPYIPRGARTSVVLALIVALWAAVFVVAIKHAMSNDPLTKQVPPSFYAASHRPVNTADFGPLGHSVLAAATDNGQPAGAVPKTGTVIGVGGNISGTVDAASTRAGVGRITVQAWRQSPRGPALVSSAATGSDGGYSLVGLLPGVYQLRFMATGYQSQWYPDAPSQAQASPVQVSAMADTTGVDATVTGLPGSITGTVETGQSPAPPVTVTVLPGQGSGSPIATVTSNAQGVYTIPNLPTPGTYDLSFTAAGYQVASDTEALSGGEAHIANTVTLSAATGTLGGTVTDGHSPLGGVTITANANGRTVTSATPTTGAVGSFTIANLATPATYLVTFSKPGYGTDTVAEHLGPGQSLTNLSVTLAGGAGQVSGQVTTTAGAALGGATVTVDGGTTPVTTQTLTAGSVGSYLLSGLTTPATYTLTFSLSGYQPQTLAVPLASNGSATGVDVTLTPATGTIKGTVTSSGGTPLAGVTVSVTDGSTTRKTVTTSSPAGGYQLLGLSQSAYSVTFSLTGYQPTTVLVQLQAGQDATASATLSGTS